MDPVKIYAKITYEDYRSIMLRHNIKYFLFTAVATLLFIGNFIYTFIPLKAQYNIPILAIIVLMLLSPFYRLWRLKKTAESITTHIDYEFINDIVIITHPDSHQKVHLSSIRYALEMKNLIVLYVGKHSVHLIPQRCIHSYNDLDQLRDLLQNNVPKTKLKSKGTYPINL